jgi:hypothetical protein
LKYGRIELKFMGHTAGAQVYEGIQRAEEEMEHVSGLREDERERAEVGIAYGQAHVEGIPRVRDVIGDVDPNIGADRRGRMESLGTPNTVATRAARTMVTVATVRRATGNLPAVSAFRIEK